MKRNHNGAGVPGKPRQEAIVVTLERENIVVVLTRTAREEVLGKGVVSLPFGGEGTWSYW